MRIFHLAALVIAAGTASPGAAAAAGWTAKQVSRTVGGGNAPAQISTLYFDKGLLRFDSEGDSSSAIVELASGKFTFLNHKLKKHAVMTVEELVTLRDQQLAQMKAQLPSYPPEVKKQVEAQIAEIEGAPKPESIPKANGKNDKVNGYDCAIYQWKQGDRDNEACISKKLGVDVKAFTDATTKLSDRLHKATGGKSGPGAFAMLELGKHGFLVRMKSTIKQGEATIEVISELSFI